MVQATPKEPTFGGQTMPLTRRTAVLGAAAGPLLASLPRTASASDAARAAYVDQARRGVMRVMQAHAIPGVAAALIVDGEPAWMQCFGETGGPASRPVDADTIFSLQSTSKTFCATA